MWSKKRLIIFWNNLNLLKRFPKAERKDLSCTEKFPGPGAYSQEMIPEKKYPKKHSNFSKSKKTASYIEHLSKYQTPGPGNYEINEKFFKSERSVIKFEKNFHSFLKNQDYFQKTWGKYYELSSKK